MRSRALLGATLATALVLGCMPSGDQTYLRRCNAVCDRVIHTCHGACALSCGTTAQEQRCTTEAYAFMDCLDAASDAAFCASPNECTQLGDAWSACLRGGDGGVSDGGG